MECLLVEIKQDTNFYYCFPAIVLLDEKPFFDEWTTGYLNEKEKPRMLKSQNVRNENE